MDAAGHHEPDGERAASQKSPDAFRTISEVSADLDVPQHVLRFWEGKFAQIRPLKRGGGRRYYRPEDVDLLRGIQHLLYGDGYTIKGVQKLLRENGVKHIVAAGRRETQAAKTAKAVPPPSPAASLGGAPHFAQTPQPPVVETPATPLPPAPAKADASLVAAQTPETIPAEPAVTHSAPAEMPGVTDDDAESRRIETAAKLLARLKALRRDFDTRLQAAKNGR
jgi:DNA-binding transcriptional MerR regulator